MSAPKTFTGFRGVAMICQIGKLKFIVVATNQRELEELHEAILPDCAVPFDATACQKSIVVHASLLPEKKFPTLKPSTPIVEINATEISQA